MPEILLRYLMFGDSTLARDLGESWRDPGSYCKDASDPFYWKLGLHLDPEGQDAPSRYDAELGWVRRGVVPGTYEHEARARLDGRRPVLLYGASFAACVLPESECFESLLEESELATTHALVNYGTGGYGFDQMVLLYRRTIDRFEDLDPIVIFAPVVEGDLDRVLMDFRGWPKPRFVPDGPTLRLETDLPRRPEDYRAHFELGLTSYVWRYAVHGTDLVPQRWRSALTGEGGRRALQDLVVTRLLDELLEEVRARGHRCFFLLFRSWPSLRNAARPSWQKTMLTDPLQRAGLDWIDTAPYLLHAAWADGCEPSAYYFHEGLERNHLTARGNEVVFRAFLDGLHGHFRAR